MNESSSRSTDDASLEIAVLDGGAKSSRREGGWGWVVVFASGIVYFIVFGSLRCQSVLLLPIIVQYQSDYASVGWVSAIATAGLAVSGVISAYLMTKVGHRLTIMIGGLIASLASVASAFAPSVAVLDVTAGLMTGLGLGISFVAAPVIIGLYFTKRRALATNIASMGSSIGSFALCPLNGWLVDKYNLDGYYLILGGIFLHLCVVGSLMRPPPNPVSEKIDISNKTTENLCEDVEDDISSTCKELIKEKTEKPKKEKTLASLAKNLPFIVYCLSQVVFLAGFLTSQLYIVPFAERELHISELQAPLLLSIAAGTEFLSRIIFGILGDVKTINRLLMFAGVLLILAICAFIIPFTNSFETLAAAAAVMGLFQGGFSGISIVVLADIVGIERYGTALGISTLLNGIGTLMSPPLLGIAVDKTNRPSVAIFISAGLLFLGAVLTFMIEVAARFQKRSTRIN